MTKGSPTSETGSYGRAAGLPDSLSRAPVFSTKNNNYSNKTTITTTITEIV